MRRRRARALLLVLIGWLLVAVVTASPAAAHAELESTAPGDGASLGSAPAEVVLRFTEPVSLGAGYVRLVDERGQQLVTGAPTVDGDTVTLPVPDDLADAGYLVTYRVISADSHPVSGSIGFTVGDADPVGAGLADAATASDPVVTGLTVAARWLGYAGLALALGVPAFLLLCWPAGWTSNRLRSLSVAGAGAVAAGGLLGFLAQGPYAAGLGPAALLDPALLQATAAETYGATLLVRTGLALALVVALRAAPRRTALNAGVLLSAGLVVTTAAVGHPVAGPAPALAVPVAAVHVGAMALWLGGLVALLAGLLRPGVRAGDLATALPRFSGLALGSVVALVLSGVAQTVREVGSPTALVSTTYGRVLGVKLLLFLVVLAAAGVSRVWVQQRLGAGRPRGPVRRVTAHAFAAPGPDAPSAVEQAASVRAAAQAETAVTEVGPFRRAVLLEAAVVAVVLVLSAVLAGTPPARAALADPVDVTLPLRGASGEAGTVQVSLDPARSGPNSLHLYLYDADGRLTQPVELRVTLTEEQQRIGPIEVALVPGGPGHSVADGLDIPGAGTWTLLVTARFDEFTATRARTTVVVR